MQHRLNRLHLLCLWLLFFSGVALGNTPRIPAHVFPDSDADVITHLQISEDEKKRLNRVLDPSLSEPWFWTTHSGEFTGYVRKRDIAGRNKLHPGTLIRMNPTHSSWVLTQFEPDDEIRIRSRLSVGRVSIRKEIPVYFQLPTTTSEETPKELTEDVPLADPEPVTSEKPRVDPPPEEPVLSPLDSPAGELHFEDITAEPILPRVVTEEVSDPLLEELPRIDAQTLADIGPPASTIEQSFHGFLRLIPATDQQSRSFSHQLETRSGRRIVYVDIRELTGHSIKDFVDEWVAVTGSLEEDTADTTLYILVNSIRLTD